MIFCSFRHLWRSHTAWSRNRKGCRLTPELPPTSEGRPKPAVSAGRTHCDKAREGLTKNILGPSMRTSPEGQAKNWDPLMHDGSVGVDFALAGSTGLIPVLYNLIHCGTSHAAIRSSSAVVSNTKPATYGTLVRLD